MNAADRLRFNLQRLIEASTPGTGLNLTMTQLGYPFSTAHQNLLDSVIRMEELALSGELERLERFERQMRPLF